MAMRSAHKFRLLVAAVVITAGVYADSAWCDPSEEDAVETYTNRINFPASPNGNWTFPICRGCSTQTVKLDEKSQFYVGKKSLSLAALKNYANSNSAHSMTIFYRWTDHVLTRIVVNE